MAHLNWALTTLGSLRSKRPTMESNQVALCHKACDHASNWKIQSIFFSIQSIYVGLKFTQFSVISLEGWQLHTIAADRIKLSSNLRVNIQRNDILGDGSSPEVIFFPRWVKHLRFQTDNVLSPSAQCIEAANKVRQMIFMIRRSFQDPLKSVFIPFYGALVRRHASLSAKPRGRYQPSTATSNIIN